MALIRCPACHTRVSDRALQCACGQPIRDAAPEDHPRRQRRAQDRRRLQLKIQLLAAITLFVAGALWIIAINLGASVLTLRAERWPLALVGLGGLWYILVRGRLWWIDR